MILLDWLQAKAKRVVEEYISIVRRRACCAPEVMLHGYCKLAYSLRKQSVEGELDRQ